MTSENLYVVKRTFTDSKKPTGDSFNVSLPATFTDLKSAKQAAVSELIQESYEPEFFPRYVVNKGQSNWTYGDGVMIFAEGPAGEIFKVEIETVPNAAGFEADDTGRVRRPLHHILQTVIHYDRDETGAQRDSMIEGTYSLRETAQTQAMKVLLNDSVRKEDFAEYDEYSGGTEGPFGADVVVHAVRNNGENILVSVVSDFHV